MIRTADAAGMDAVILGMGTADSYNPKTVRSAQGSHFNIPIVKGDLIEWTAKAKEAGIQVLGTGLKNAVNHSDIWPQAEFALIVGNEGSGVNPELLAMADNTVENSNVRQSRIVKRCSCNGNPVIHVFQSVKISMC